MNNTLKEFAGSKKAIAAIATALVVILVEFVPQLAPVEDAINQLVALAVAYLLGQGLADFGKHQA